MKKMVFLGLLMGSVSANALQIADNPAYLESTGISTGSCTLIDSNGDASPTPAVGFTVSTHSADGNAMFKCRGKVTAPTTKGAMMFDNATPPFVGAQCDIYEDGVYLGSTDDWQEIISASGQAVLSCHKHP